MTFGSNTQVLLFMLAFAIPLGASLHIGWLIGQEMARSFFTLVAKVSDKIKADAKPVKRGRGRPRKSVATV